MSQGICTSWWHNCIHFLAVFSRKWRQFFRVIFLGNKKKCFIVYENVFSALEMSSVLTSMRHLQSKLLTTPGQSENYKHPFSSEFNSHVRTTYTSITRSIIMWMAHICMHDKHPVHMLFPQQWAFLMNSLDLDVLHHTCSSHTYTLVWIIGCTANLATPLTLYWMIHAHNVHKELSSAFRKDEQ